MPDRKVDCSRTTSDAVLSTAPYSCLKLLKEGDHACVLYLSASDFSVDATDATCVDADACPLSNIPPNSHIATEDAIQGVININKNATCILTKWCSNSCHDWRWDVDFVFGDCVIVSLDV